MSVCCDLSGRGVGDELITRLEKSHRRWCVIVCDLETLRMRRPWPSGAVAPKKENSHEKISMKPPIRLRFGVLTIAVFLGY
jgi:hypothetical protein